MLIFLASTTPTEVTTAITKAVSGTSGFKLDLTVTISVIIALCSILSNLATAILNNWHQSKMKKIELEQQHYENNVLYKRKIFENYLKSAGQYILYHSFENEAQYGEYYFLALMYAPSEIAEQMKLVHSYISDIDYASASNCFEDLASKMHTLLRTM